ncbi:hypothetical protein MKAN_10505 [Mycobacterium kansasii ATCC 12478]|uniref:Uncharacterized protein n=1 Tax=Mycobacterium kansasii ATCC 12478 TaxID=557599 RepID=U5WYY6_MYCKA|nr:hypothetical protein MKAN_10505 [Mycobacterium kansasii ATCC 12478]
MLRRGNSSDRVRSDRDIAGFAVVEEYYWSVIGDQG